MTFAMSGPWNLQDIKGESLSLRRIYTQTLQVNPFSTMMSVSRIDGIVEVAFTTTARAQTLEKLKTDAFRRQFEANILQANPDLARSMFINESDVVGFFVLEGLWELSAVQDFEEDLRTQFSFVLRMNPDQIEQEITTNGKMVQIIYKAKGNPQQLAPLYDGAQFTENLRTHIIGTNPALAQVLGWGCPAQRPLFGAPCVGAMHCSYGQECCCGDCFPSEVFTCDDNVWTGMFTDACLGPCGPVEPYRLPGDAELPEIEFEGPGAYHGLQKAASPEETSDNGINYTHLTLLITFGVILGIFFGQLTRWLCSKKKVSMIEQTNDLYHDISLDTQVLARSV